MPIVDLINSMGNAPPENVKRVANGLCYRDFLTVGLLVPKLLIKNETKIPTRNELVPDNWIYIQERDVRVGRLQIFQNWSPYMIKDPNKVWMGLEYFCQEGDDLWSMPDPELCRFGAEELEKIGICEADSVEDSIVVRVEKTYPAYFGTYDEFSVIRGYVDQLQNLYLVGRNGMHRYNNADHSMLSAMTVVDNLIAGNSGRANIWEVNTEQEYHEEKK